jgi:hypothetical protein
MHMRHTAEQLNRLVPILLATVVTACGCGGDGTDPEGSKDTKGVEAYVLKGTVKNAAGQPLSGVTVMADDTNRYNAHTMGVTDANGAYRIELDPDRTTSYRALASIETRWDGQEWVLSLAPDTSNPFTGKDGAIRHFTWKLQGEHWDGTAYGSEVVVVRDLEDTTIDLDRIEVELVPAGPRIDGSTGTPLTLRLVEGHEHQDVPLGRYTVSARDTGDPSLPIRVKVNETGDFAPSAEAGFESRTSHGRMLIEVTSR